MIALVESIAAFLSRPGEELAFLICEDSVYFSTHKQSFQTEPINAISNLIQGIYDTYPKIARSILRNRIYSTQSTPTALCFGMVKIAAKRITYGIQPIRNFLELKFNFVEIQFRRNPSSHSSFPISYPKSIQSHEEFVSLALQLAQTIQRNSVQYQSDRPIAALLVKTDPNTAKKELLAWATNSNSHNRTLHAEVNLIQNYFQNTRSLIPKHVAIYTSLKPCRMCAGMIWHSSVDRNSLKVYYGNDDPGPGAKNTILSPFTFDRKQVTQDPSELQLNLQHFLKI